MGTRDPCGAYMHACGIYTYMQAKLSPICIHKVNTKNYNEVCMVLYFFGSSTWKAEASELKDRSTHTKLQALSFTPGRGRKISEFKTRRCIELVLGEPRLHKENLSQ